MILRIKSLFFSQTLKIWHFEEIARKTNISRERVSYFLKTLVKQGFLVRVKPRGKMPYYLAARENPKFRFEKQAYGLAMLEQSGLLEHLSTLEEVKTAIIFGSFARGDWNNSSDIDLFIYGQLDNFEKGKYEKRLKREIQVFCYSSPEKIKKDLDSKLIPNILKGYNITGNLEPFRVEINV